jgi:N-acetylglucosaminyldiphosphoundecaprenol N-acetyl-beta-D-mannosaminyltransferase
MTSRSPSIETMGFSVFSSTLDKIEISGSEPKLLNTISPNSYGISTKDKVFCNALKESDYLVLDGVYFALSSILLQGKNIKKNQGPDVFYHFMEKVNTQKGKVFFLGSTPQTLKKICIRAKNEYPDITIGTYSPPYKNEFSNNDTQKMIDAVDSFKPDILFVGMTCPKQEKWAYINKKALQAKLICCVGAVFDWYAGNYKEIKKIWWTIRLGWLIRTMQRPEVLSRNIPNFYIFCRDLILVLLRIKKINQ